MRRLILIPLILLAFATSAPAQSADDLPQPLDLVMLAGADYSHTFKIRSAGVPVDITGNRYVAQFRAAPAPAGALFADYSTAITNAADGEVKIYLSRVKTWLLPGKSGVWDLLEINSSGLATFIAAGKGSVRTTATRWP